MSTNLQIEHKKIAIVSDAIYPYNKGGKEKRIYEVSTRLAKKGYIVTIYTMQWWKGKRTRVEDGVTLHAISSLYPLYSKNRRSIKEAIMFGIACFSLLREDFDVIDVDHMPHLVLFPIKIVCLIKRKRLIVSWNEVWGKTYWVSYLGSLGYIAALIEKISAYLPDYIISISPHTTQLFKKTLFNTDNITTIPCGIDIKKIDSVIPSKEKFDLMFAGRLLAHKHIDLIIDVVLELKSTFPDIRCLIIGEGPEKLNLSSLIQQRKIEKHITMRDFLPKEENLYALLKSCNVFVIPSTREGFGLVALEANACGVPVITTNHEENAARDLIKNGVNGYVTSLTTTDFSKKISLLLKKQLNRNKIKEIATQYNWDTIVSSLEGVYRK